MHQLQRWREKEIRGLLVLLVVWLRKSLRGTAGKRSKILFSHLRKDLIVIVFLESTNHLGKSIVKWMWLIVIIESRNQLEKSLTNRMWLFFSCFVALLACIYLSTMAYILYKRKKYSSSISPFNLSLFFHMLSGAEFGSIVKLYCSLLLLFVF